MLDIETMNTPFCEVGDRQCRYCEKVKNDTTFYCRICKGKKWHYMFPCTIILMKLCARADREALK